MEENVFRAARGTAISVGVFVLTFGVSAAPSTLRARVRFLAVATSVHSGEFGSEDTFLAEIQAPGKPPYLARLVDEYSSSQAPIPVQKLTSTEAVPLRLLRDPDCDREWANIVIRTAPVDPMAVLLLRLVSAPEITRSVSAAELIPCYRVVAIQHRTRLCHRGVQSLGAVARRFRFGGKKEAAGVCRGRGESRDFQSQTTDSSRVRALRCKADIAISPGRYSLRMAQTQRPRRLRLHSCEELRTMMLTISDCLRPSEMRCCLSENPMSGARRIARDVRPEVEKGFLL